MRLDAIHITTPSAVERLQNELKTDLTAPLFSSLSQYYQLQALQPRSPYIIMMLGSQPTKTINTDELPSDQNSYKLYRPTASENPQFVDMRPPSLPSKDQSEPNYYSIKPRKNKKYSPNSEKTKKYSKPENLKENIVQNEEVNVTSNIDHETAPSENLYDEDDIPQNSEDITTSEKQTNDSEEGEIEAEPSEESEVELEEISQPSTRLDFQMHGN